MVAVKDRPRRVVLARSMGISRMDSDRAHSLCPICFLGGCLSSLGRHDSEDSETADASVESGGWTCVGSHC